MRKFIFYPILLLLITLCSVPLSGKSTLPNNFIINNQEITKPIITWCSPFEVKVNKGGTVEMMCTVEPQHDPNLKHEIFFKGKPLRDSPRFEIIFNFGHFVLTINEATTYDTGIYELKFSNELGEATVSYALIVQ